MNQKKNRYSQLIEDIFFRHYEEGTRKIVFARAELVDAAEKVGIELPKNLGDIPYSFRYRTALPESIVAKTPPGYEWIIRPAGRSRYRFELTTATTIIPSQALVQTKLPDATPGIISKYALNIDWYHPMNLPRKTSDSI